MQHLILIWQEELRTEILEEQLILLNWKQAVAPTHANWMREDGAFRFRENKILITKTGG